jgi:hypothetical protein
VFVGPEEYLHDLRNSENFLWLDVVV